MLHKECLEGLLGPGPSSPDTASHNPGRLPFPELEGLVDSIVAERVRLVMEKLNDYVKTAQAAVILGVSQNTLRAWAEAGKIPCRRNPANGYRLFLRRDLEAFLARIARAKT
jgi:hypothetical protein